MWLVPRGLHSPKARPPCPSSLLQSTLKVSLQRDQGPVASPPEASHLAPCPHSPPGVVGGCPSPRSGVTGPPWRRVSQPSSSGPALPGCLVPASASTLAAMQLAAGWLRVSAGPGLLGGPGKGTVPRPRILLKVGQKDGRGPGGPGGSRTPGGAATSAQAHLPV